MEHLYLDAEPIITRGNDIGASAAGGLSQVYGTVVDAVNVTASPYLWMIVKDYIAKKIQLSSFND